jgi:hypothetical protein
MGARRFYLLATAVALAGLTPSSLRIAVAQIPDAPGDFNDSGGGEDTGEVNIPVPQTGSRPRPDQPAPDPARDTIDEFDRARARAEGTPEPEPTPPGGFLGPK